MADADFAELILQRRSDLLEPFSRARRDIAIAMTVVIQPVVLQTLPLWSDPSLCAAGLGLSGPTVLYCIALYATRICIHGLAMSPMMTEGRVSRSSFLILP